MKGKEPFPKITTGSEHDSGFTNSLRNRPELVSMRHPNTLTRFVMDCGSFFYWTVFEVAAFWRYRKQHYSIWKICLCFELLLKNLLLWTGWR